MVKKYSRFDIADYLTDDKMIAEYLSSVIDEEDTSLLISAIGDVAKARGMSHIATLSGLGRESLYKALSPGSKPRFDTIIKVLKALDISLQFSSTKNKLASTKQVSHVYD